MNIRSSFGNLARGAIVALAVLAFLAAAGCMDPQESEPELRQFAPRLLQIPSCKKVRVEVAEWDLGDSPVDGNIGDAYYQVREADQSQNRIDLDGLPWGRTLYFRITGIDTTGSVVWSTFGGVPDGQQAGVTVGSGGYQPQTISIPAINSTVDPLVPQIQCGSGSTWPAWTLDGSAPSEKNSSTRTDRTGSQVSVPLSSGQILSARCFDDFRWSAPSVYQAPTGPGVLPAQNGPGSDFALTPDFAVPATSAGSIGITANTSSFSGFSNWKVVYRLNNTGSWTILDLTASTSVSYGGAGSIAAYLIAWNGSKWASGGANSTSYPSGPTSPVANGPADELSAPTLSSPTSLPGTVGVVRTGVATDLTNWKIVYRIATAGIWEIVDYSTNSVPVQYAGSMDVYLMAWSASQNRWLSGSMATTTYPTGAPAPTLIGEGTALSAPTISVPAFLPGQVAFAATNPDPNCTDWHVAFKLSDTGAYRLARIDSSIYASANGKVVAYLIAWNSNLGQWVSGPSATKTIGQSSAEPLVVSPGGPLPAVVIHGTSTVPGTCTFAFPATSPATSGYSDWKVVYQLPGGTEWVVLDTGKSVSFTVTGNISAYFEAWSLSGQHWVSGPVNSITVPTAVVLDPPVFKDADGNTLDSAWEQDGNTLSLQIAGAGTIYYTTNGGYPSPGMSGTSMWDPSQKLTFPLDVSTLTIQAVARSAGVTSNASQLLIRRPLWTRLDNIEAGCVQSAGNLVLACGDATGPWRWDTTSSKWTPLDPSWTVGQARQLLITPKSVFATLRTGVVRRLDRTAAANRFAELDLRTRPANLGGLAVARDTLWASTSAGPYFYDVAADTWAAPALPSGTAFSPSEGPAWSNGTVLWMAFGSELWRYGPTTAGPIGWEQWNSTFPNVSWLGPDPFSATSAAMGYGGNFGQIGTTRMVASSNYLFSPSGAAVVQVASHGTNAYAATDNGTGTGGVVRAAGWSAGNWSGPERDWPSVSNRTISSQGVAAFAAHGNDWLLATTPQGTYVLKLK